MDEKRAADSSPAKHPTTVDRKSDLDLYITRTFDGPARLVFEAWTRPELLKRWWLPKSCGATFVSCELDARTGGSYRFVFGHPASEQTMAFFGKYLEVTPPVRLVWTNEEGGEGGSVTTVSFEDLGGQTRVVMHDRYATKEALEEAIGGSASGFNESFGQLDDMLESGGL